MESITGTIDLSEVKECVAPGIVLKVVCPFCKTELVCDFGDNKHYLNYPKLGKENCAYFYCEHCADNEQKMDDGSRFLGYLILPVNIKEIAITVNYNASDLVPDE